MQDQVNENESREQDHENAFRDDWMGAGSASQEIAGQVTPSEDEASKHTGAAESGSDSVGEDHIVSEGVEEDGTAEDSLERDGVTDEGFRENLMADESFEEDGTTSESFEEDGITDDDVEENGLAEESVEGNGTTSESLEKDEMASGHAEEEEDADEAGEATAEEQGAVGEIEEFDSSESSEQGSEIEFSKRKTSVLLVLKEAILFSLDYNLNEILTAAGFVVIKEKMFSFTQETATEYYMGNPDLQNPEHYIESSTEGPVLLFVVEHTTKDTYTKLSSMVEKLILKKRIWQKTREDVEAVPSNEAFSFYFSASHEIAMQDLDFFFNFFDKIALQRIPIHIRRDKVDQQQRQDLEDGILNAGMRILHSIDSKKSVQTAKQLWDNVSEEEHEAGSLEVPCTTLIAEGNGASERWTKLYRSIAANHAKPANDFISKPACEGNDVSDVKMEFEMEGATLKQELTLAIIKPSALKEGLLKPLLKTIADNLFVIIAKKEVQLGDVEAHEFLKISTSCNSQELIDDLTSGRCLIMVLSRNGGIRVLKDIIGPTNSVDAKRRRPSSLFALYSHIRGGDVLHGSSHESAAKEINFFFPLLQANVEHSDVEAAERLLMRVLTLKQPVEMYHNKSIILKTTITLRQLIMRGIMEMLTEEPEDLLAALKWFVNWLELYHAEPSSDIISTKNLNLEIKNKRDEVITEGSLTMNASASLEEKIKIFLLIGEAKEKAKRFVQTFENKFRIVYITVESLIERFTIKKSNEDKIVEGCLMKQTSLPRELLLQLLQRSVSHFKGVTKFVLDTSSFPAAVAPHDLSALTDSWVAINYVDSKKGDLIRQENNEKDVEVQKQLQHVIEECKPMGKLRCINHNEEIHLKNAKMENMLLPKVLFLLSPPGLSIDDIIQYYVQEANYKHVDASLLDKHLPDNAERPLGRSTKIKDTIQHTTCYNLSDKIIQKTKEGSTRFIVTNFPTTRDELYVFKNLVPCRHEVLLLDLYDPQCISILIKNSNESNDKIDNFYITAEFKKLINSLDKEHVLKRIYCDYLLRCPYIAISSIYDAHLLKSIRRKHPILTSVLLIAPPQLNYNSIIEKLLEGNSEIFEVNVEAIKDEIERNNKTEKKSLDTTLLCIKELLRIAYATNSAYVVLHHIPHHWLESDIKLLDEWLPLAQIILVKSTISAGKDKIVTKEIEDSKMREEIAAYETLLLRLKAMHEYRHITIELLIGDEEVENNIQNKWKEPWFPAVYFSNDRQVGMFVETLENIYGYAPVLPQVLRLNEDKMGTEAMAVDLKLKASEVAASNKAAQSIRKPFTKPTSMLLNFPQTTKQLYEIDTARLPLKLAIHIEDKKRSQFSSDSQSEDESESEHQDTPKNVLAHFHAIERLLIVKKSLTSHLLISSVKGMKYKIHLVIAPSICGINESEGEVIVGSKEECSALYMDPTYQLGTALSDPFLDDAIMKEVGTEVEAAYISSLSDNVTRKIISLRLLRSFNTRLLMTGYPYQTKSNKLNRLYEDIKLLESLCTIASVNILNFTEEGLYTLFGVEASQSKMKESLEAHEKLSSRLTSYYFGWSKLRTFSITDEMSREQAYDVIRSDLH